LTDFYRKFEDKYRGSRTLILNRLQKYHPVLLNCLNQFANPVALDLGCGRGEWLEYLSGLGYQASGIDLDSGMLEACRERHLQVTCANLFEYLPQVPDQSVHLLSAFHLIEHITFSQLQTLMQEAKRILAPNGLLILETPNPENVSVSCTSFYLDPTHEKPIPPLFMEFMAEYHGFVNAQIARLDNYKVIDDAQPTTLNDVLFYASPDYALIAQAPANPQWNWSTGILDALNGHSLEDMANRFDQQQTSQTEQQAVLTEQQASIAEQIQHVHQELQALRIFQHEVTHSYAWKLIAPLRWLQTNINKLRHRAK
jgi:ubiquinone/menaquinone biosynthesis C-methylase UbiE